MREEFIDLCRIDDDELRRRVPDPEPRVSLAAMKHIHDPLPAFLGVVAEFLEDFAGDRDILLNIGTNVIDYASHVHPEVPPAEMLSLFTTLTQEKDMTTMVDLLREQGLQQGRQEGRQEDIEKLLLKGVLSPEEIASVLEVDRAWVEEIARKVLRHP